MSGAQDNSTREKRVNEIIAQYMQAREKGLAPDRDEWIAQHPDYADDLKVFFENDRDFGRFLNDDRGSDELETTRTHLGRAQETHEQSPSSFRRASIARGSVLDGSYRIIDIKQGGMGRLFIADVLPNKMLSLFRKVAIKTIPDFEEWRDARSAQKRTAKLSDYRVLSQLFLREVKTWVKLGARDHVIHAYFVTELGGKPYLLMEYAEAGDLKTWIYGNRLTGPLAVNLAIQFCTGMSDIHASGVIHRDIKPANVLLCRPYLVKISDLGLAKAFNEPLPLGTSQEAIAAAAVTAAGGGTLPYMAPEQLVNGAQGDTRSDIFAFGAMLFEMLIRKVLFNGVGYEAMEQRRDSISRVLRGNGNVPRVLLDLIARCVAYQPGDRYACFEEIRRELVCTSKEFASFPPLPKVQRPMVEQRMQTSLQAGLESYSLLSLGEYERAADTAQNGIAADPQNAGHWINRGVALSQLGSQTEEAMRCLRRATQIAPDDPKSWANLAFALLESGDVASAQTAACKATTVDGESPDAWFALGACEQKAGARNDAVQSLARAAELAPNNWKIYLRLAACLRELRQHRRALEYLSWGNRINPTSPELLTETASNLFLVGQDAAARAAVDQALQLGPRCAAALILRGMILWDQTHDATAALRDIHRAIELEPDNQAARNLRAEIQSGERKTGQRLGPKRRVTDAAFFVTDLGAASLARHLRATVQRMPPRSLVAQADARMELSGALVSYMSGRSLCLENVPEMGEQEWKSFLDRRFCGQTWWRWFGKTRTAMYSVVVVVAD